MIARPTRRGLASLLFPITRDVGDDRDVGDLPSPVFLIPIA
jgi:hypothetical protein